jgi:hypothetical protein
MGILRDGIRKKLQGDKPPQGNVFGFIDNAHPAATQLFNNAIVRNGLTNHYEDAVSPGGFILGIGLYLVNE